MFSYSPSIIEKFPAIRAGVVHVRGVRNAATPATLLEEYEAEQMTAIERLSTIAVADLPSIAAWRRAFAQFGVKPTQYRSAVEALLRRLTKQGSIPSINLLVDLGNLVSIRWAVPVAVIDLAGVDGGITVAHAAGTEPFSDLGADGDTSPEPGEVVFLDDAGTVHARRWCWRQSRQSATSPVTTDALVVIEAHHAAAGSDIDGAMSDLMRLLVAHQPEAQASSEVLSADRPAVR